MVKKYDIDGSGEIEYEEFVCMLGSCIFDLEIDPELTESYLVFSKGREDASVGPIDIQFIMEKFGF